jgi:hypothetical protein
MLFSITFARQGILLVAWQGRRGIERGGEGAERKRGSANKSNVIMPTRCLWVLTLWLCCSIYEVHDEAKDKAFELELSWVCDESNKQHQRVCLLPPGYMMSFCSCFPTLFNFFWSCSFVVLDLMSRTNGWHLQVPADLLEEAKAAAKAAKDALDEDEGMDAD